MTRRASYSKVAAMILEDRADEVTGLLKAIANRHRLRIIRLLADKEYSVGELEKIVGLSQSALSQHLARLRRDKMVTTRRSAQTIYYSLAGSLPRTLVECLTTVFSQAQLADPSLNGTQVAAE
jgi:DNA-binding transcriptional ArsR family regulator